MEAGGRPAGKLRSRVTYLEMTAPPAAPEPPFEPARSVRIEPARGLSVKGYRALYRSIGTPWLWWERLLMPDAVLAAILADARVEIRLLTVAGAVAGYSELDLRGEDGIELAYLGLAEAFIGEGLGRHLLAETLGAAWARRPRRVWLHTCSEDHPGALAFYRAAGFRPCRTEETLIDDPRLTGLLPRDAAPHVPLAI